MQRVVEYQQGRFMAWRCKRLCVIQRTPSAGGYDSTLRGSRLYCSSSQRDHESGEHCRLHTRVTARKRLILATTIVGVLIIAYVATSWLFSERLIAATFPARVSADFSRFGLPAPENITLINGPIRLAAWYFSNPRHSGCGVVEIHGFEGNRAQILVAAPLFWDRGCDLLLYDLRSHGESSGSLLTYGVLDKQDALVAIDWLAGQMQLPHGRIALVGWSYGAAVSLQAAKARQDLAFVVADASFASLRDIALQQAARMYGRWTAVFVPGALAISGLRAGFDPALASPRDAVHDLATPVLLVHSVTDEFTPYQQSESIYANSDHAHTVIRLSHRGAPHARSYETNPPMYTRWVDEFLNAFAPTFGSRIAVAR